jgi:protein CLEC16A
MNNIKTIIKTSTDTISINNFIDMYNCLKEINDKEKHKKYKEDLKDLIQLIIDYLIYGDSNNEQPYFDNFCELDFMKEFIKASKTKYNEILLQIIKSMSTLILSLTNQASLYYIFSNNFINDIITNDDIFLQESNVDFLSFYINFLKSLSMKINSTTIQLFFQKEKGSFPLLENAIKFYNSDDPMVKNVIRNIFLKFAKLSQEYLPLKEYYTSLPMLKYFCFISCRLTDMTLQLNYIAGYNNLYKNKFSNNSKDFTYVYDNFKSLHDDLVDEILYYQDILSINDEKIITAALNSLLYYYICPLLLGSIYNYKYFFKDEKKNINLKFIISPEIAIYIFTLIISNINNDSLLNIICSLLFKKEINSDIITNFVNIHFSGKYPAYPSNYSCSYKDQNYKEKNMSFVQYITYNFNQKFICNLLLKKNSKYKEVIQLQKKYEKLFDDPEFDPYEKYENIYNDINAKFSKKEKEFMKE